MVNADVIAFLLPFAVLYASWRFQEFLVNLLRWPLASIAGQSNAFEAFLTFFGTLLHEVSHASILLVTGQGIMEFHVRPYHGHVLPRRAFGNWYGHLVLAAAAVAPLWLIPFLTIAVSTGLLGVNWLNAPVFSPDAQMEFYRASIAVSLSAMQDTLVQAARYPFLLTVMIVTLIVASPGLRPSKFIDDDGQKSGDIWVLRRTVRRHPIPFILVICALLALVGIPSGIQPVGAAILHVLLAVSFAGILTAIVGFVFYGFTAIMLRIVRGS